MGLLNRIIKASIYVVRGKLPRKKRMPLVPKSKVQVPMPETQEPLKYGTWHKRAILASSKTTVDEYVKAVMLTDKEIGNMSVAIGRIIDGNTNFYNQIAKQTNKLKYKTGLKPSIYIIYYLLNARHYYVAKEKLPITDYSDIVAKLKEIDYFTIGINEKFPEMADLYFQEDPRSKWTAKEYAVEFNRIMKL